MLKRILDFFWSPCPSGLPHRTRWGTVTNYLGKQYCWHQDCMRANFKECGVTTDAGVAVAPQQVKPPAGTDAPEQRDT